MAAAGGPGESSGAELPGACPGADSGHVSQSHSSASGLGEPEDEDTLEALLSATAAAYSAYLLADRSLFSDEVRGHAGTGHLGGYLLTAPALGPGLPGSPGLSPPARVRPRSPAAPTVREGRVRRLWPSGAGRLSTRRRFQALGGVLCRCVESLRRN